LLADIANHVDLGAAYVLKGGTYLKKCYFETYRFSEDLNFTPTDAGMLDESRLIPVFDEIVDWDYEQACTERPRDTIRFEVYENKRGGLSAEGWIGCRVPLQRRGGSPRIKLDLTYDEVLVMEPANREVHHPYSDRPDGGIQIQCYDYEEVFAEKVRVLAERERPRDLYDVVHLYRHKSERPDRSEPEAEWANMLAHQLRALPPFAQFWGELPAVFDWLRGAIEKVVPQPIPAMGGVIDEPWRLQAMVRPWHANVPLEIIRFAAANHLCGNLT